METCWAPKELLRTVWRRRVARKGLWYESHTHLVGVPVVLGLGCIGALFARLVDVAQEEGGVELELLRVHLALPRRPLTLGAVALVDAHLSRVAVGVMV